MVFQILGTVMKFSDSVITFSLWYPYRNAFFLELQCFFPMVFQILKQQKKKMVFQIPMVFQILKQHQIEKKKKWISSIS